MPRTLHNIVVGEQSITILHKEWAHVSCSRTTHTRARARMHTHTHTQTQAPHTYRLSHTQHTHTHKTHTYTHKHRHHTHAQAFTHTKHTHVYAHILPDSTNKSGTNRLQIKPTSTDWQVWAGSEVLRTHAHMHACTHTHTHIHTNCLTTSAHLVKTRFKSKSTASTDWHVWVGSEVLAGRAYVLVLLYHGEYHWRFENIIALIV